MYVFLQSQLCPPRATRLGRPRAGVSSSVEVVPHRFSMGSQVLLDVA